MRFFSVSLPTTVLWLGWLWKPSLCFWSIRCTSSAPKKRLLQRVSLLQAQQQQRPQEWSIVDDWDSRSQHENRPAESRDIFHQDIIGRAAYYMQQQGQDTVYSNETLEHDAWMSQVVQDIHPEENTATNKENRKNWILDELEEDDQEPEENNSLLDEDIMSQEIAQLIRCNEQPEQFLIQLGRAVPALTPEELHDVRQLVTLQDNSNDDESTSTMNSAPTPFFQQAVTNIFHQYAKETPLPGGGEHRGETTTTTTTTTRAVLDKPALAAWLQRSLSIPSVGPHDPRITKLISTFGKYGQGFLELDDFQTLYFQAVVGTTAKQTATANTPPSDPTTYYYKMLKQQRSYEIEQVWKDLEIHGVEPPALVEWKERVRALEQEQNQVGGAPTLAVQNDPSILFHDECELVDPADAAVDSWSQNKETGTWKRTGKSSHERIELCKCSSRNNDSTNTKIPLRFKDGDFVYIDEESCIGCTQCALAAPGSFLMLENGRARTFHQDISPAVAAAVTTCPVNCMHYVGFDRLVELEKARDDGILPSRPGDTHRHFGPKQAQASSTSATKKNQEEASQWISHTPLYVSRMQSSDANHKESIYHYLRNQCYKSSACPQKGCFDCPMYASNPTSNPHWQRRVKQAYHIRAQHFQENTNLPDAFRKKAEL